MRLALLSNVTVDLLAEMLRKTDEVYLAAGYDTWQQEMMTAESGLSAFRPEAVAVLIHAGANGADWDDPEEGRRTIDEWLGAIGAYAAVNPGTPVFVSSIDAGGGACRYGAERRLEVRAEQYLTDGIEKMHEEGRKTYVLPVKDLITEMGRKAFYSPKMWYMGSMPYTMKGLEALKGLILRYAGGIRGAKKKCLAVDLDNTLWGGVIGEDGADGILLSNHKEGARYRDTQKLLKKMKDRGVMLAILSRNNPEDAEAAFAHPEMVLRREDFVGEKINWNPKAENLRQLAAELNIGTDAFVFLDDNPAEREAMAAENPEVAVIDFPRDTALLPETVARAYDEYFFALEVTGEDAGKTEMYRAESRRQAEKSAAATVEEYLKRLEMTMDLHGMKAEEEARVGQLINKTNQFNLTTKRYSPEEIHAISESGDREILTIQMADKYGGQGLVSVLILEYEGEKARIDTFLMSCRVMGRKAEDEIMARVRERLTSRGIRQVEAAYRQSAKNAPVEDLYERLGFTVTAESESEKQYRAEVSDLPGRTGIFRSPEGEQGR